MFVILAGIESALLIFGFGRKRLLKIPSLTLHWASLLMMSWRSAASPARSGDLSDENLMNTRQTTCMTIRLPDTCQTEASRADTKSRLYLLVRSRGRGRGFTCGLEKGL